MLLKDKVAVVTGSGAGIGKAIAERFAAEGAWVVVAERCEETGNLVTASIRQAGGEASFVKCDVTKEADIVQLFRGVQEKHGKLDILVNNAGVAGPAKQVVDLSWEEWRSTLAANIDSVFLCCKHALKIMLRQRWGVIINMASVSGKRPMPLRSSYTTSKMAVIGFTRTLAAEVGPSGIRVNAICPGSVSGERQDIVFKGIMASTGKSYEEVRAMKTESAALRRFVEPKNVAAMAVFLSCEDSEAITGQDINVCAGAVMY
jgi:NAD(P)-dependent dehydrogenase (short-subunit alcohol dehydrogenase family)